VSAPAEPDLLPLEPGATWRTIADHYKTGTLIHQLMGHTGYSYERVRACLTRAGVKVRDPREAVELHRRLIQEAP